MKYILGIPFLTIFYFWTQLIYFMWNLKWHQTNYKEFMSEYF